MAIAQMEKVIIVSHRSETSSVLEALQNDGICQVLNAEQAAISKDSPDLIVQTEKPKNVEQKLSRVEKSIRFLGNYSPPSNGLASILSPKTVIEKNTYDKVVTDKQMLKVIEQAEEIETHIEELTSEREAVLSVIAQLTPWEKLQTPVEQIASLEKATALTGLVPIQHYDQIQQEIKKSGAAIQLVDTAGNYYSCLIVCLNENLAELQKHLRSVEFEQVTFEAMEGKAADLLNQNNKKLKNIKQQLANQDKQAAGLAANLLNLKILYDHYVNLLDREKTRTEAPGTNQTLLLEGWVKKHDYPQLQKIINGFKASTLHKTKPGEKEQIPVEIENSRYIKPFEVITRLYGMPQHFDVDPTVFLAPFFALFFGLCLTDAGYGIIIVLISAFFLKKMQGDKKLFWMLGVCGAATIVAGALTGGWFGDAIQNFIPALKPLREKMMWFDPLDKPMIFFAMALILGYVQILTGLVIAFIHNLIRKRFLAAICDQLTWLILLNSLVIYGAGKADAVPETVGRIFGLIALVPAAMIFLFSQRQGGWGGRLGMGAYNLFSAIFYMGDVLSYLRLMALGMVTAGLAMAVNIIAKITLDIPFVGFIIMIIVLIGGHAFNIAISTLSAFVHTLRLQYVEFFPKFFSGGGLHFEPLGKNYKHIYIEKNKLIATRKAG